MNLRALGRAAGLTAAFSAGATVAAVVANALGADHLVVFALSAAALAGLATLIGQATEQLGHRFGPRTTGILQSALGNLPELFISIFALQAGARRSPRSCSSRRCDRPWPACESRRRSWAW